MSIYSAMQSGVSGLFAQAQKVSKISDNIANANTVGYKRSFTDFVTSTASSIGSGAAVGANTTFPAGVRAVIRSEINRQGNVMNTNSATDLSITGRGFFVVGKNPDSNLESNFMMSRAGSFTLNEDGYLVNSAGYYLHGFKYNSDGELGLVDTNGFGDLEAINIGNIAMIGAATTTMTISGNLPAQETGLATPGNPFISSAEYFTPLGVSERIVMEWQPSTNPNEWTMTVTDQDGNTYGSVDVVFNDSGASAGSPQTWQNVTNLATAPNGFAFDTATGVATITVNNGATPQNIEISLGATGTFTGITQFAGDYTPQQITRDGAMAGALSRVEITEGGVLYGVFDNGSRKALYQIPLGDVTNPDSLMQTDGNAYRLTQQAGAFRLMTANTGSTGTINSGTLERSNVDIAEELTLLIETQRAYSSNAKIITTADEMLDETTRLKR